MQDLIQDGNNKNKRSGDAIDDNGNINRDLGDSIITNRNGRNKIFVRKLPVRRNAMYPGQKVPFVARQLPGAEPALGASRMPSQQLSNLGSPTR